MKSENKRYILIFSVIIIIFLVFRYGFTLIFYVTEFLASNPLTKQEKQFCDSLKNEMQIKKISRGPSYIGNKKDTLKRQSQIYSLVFYDIQYHKLQNIDSLKNSAEIIALYSYNILCEKSLIFGHYLVEFNSKNNSCSFNFYFEELERKNKNKNYIIQSDIIKDF